ncbi:MAG: 23S rRNA (guanosine(2251)-2'-O)-methyltransferase RlmB [Candidatus Fimenecus sp.]
MDNNAGLIIGRIAIKEAINSGRKIALVYMLKGDSSQGLKNLSVLLTKKSIPIKYRDRIFLDKLCKGENHQGVVAEADVKDYIEFSELLNKVKDKEKSLIVICAGLQDPRNLGAIIRTCDACGADGVIIPKNRSVSLNFSVEKTSAGALEYVDVARVVNLGRCIDEFKENGFWVYAADMDGQPFGSVDYAKKAVLVVGAEGNGVPRLIKEKCDFTVSISLRGHINSLNVSVAAGILMYAMTEDN